MIRQAIAVRDLYGLTEGKNYQIVDIQEGIFAERPYIGIINDYNNIIYCHYYRLNITKKECYDYIKAKYYDQLPIGGS